MRSLTLALVLALGAAALTVPAFAASRTIGQIIDDAAIVAEVKAKLTADKLSNLTRIDVKSENGVVTLGGTVDSSEKRARAAQIAGSVNGVKGLVNNIQVAGAGMPPTTSSSGGVPPVPTGASTIDATGTVASVDASSGTITLSDGRVLRAGDRTSVYQPTTVTALKPGDQVLLRGATPMTVRAPETRMGTVARVDTARQELVLTDGTIVRVPTFANVHRGTERLALSQIDPGAEVVIQLSPAPAASPGTTAPPSTSPTSRPAPAGVVTLDATDVSVVWPPSATRR